MASSGLLVVSARLPVTLEDRDQGWEASPSPGGLVTALRLVGERRAFTWMGWPGTFVPEAEHVAVRAVLERHGSVPVFIDQAGIEGFHRGYSSRILWPLLHGMIARARFDTASFGVFRTVSQQFAAEISTRTSPSAVLWIHDFQLALVPQLLRDRGHTGPIGFFLHIPFPGLDMFRNLPEREAILRGILGADVIGFQSHEYASHFRDAAVHLLGAVATPSGLRLGAHEIRTLTLPIGVDLEESQQMASSREARQELASLQATYAGRRIVVGVDRFDYTKGIPEKLRAFELLLERNPRARQRVVLIQIAAPSRMEIFEYQQLKREVDELVGRINGRFGSPSFMPVVYVNQSISRERLTGVYRAADIAMVTPLRDGMNLVALEYVAARTDRGGSLILSEFTGAAHCLPGARLVNPYDTARVAETLADCLDKPWHGSESFAHMRSFVETNSVTRWAEDFLDELEARAARQRSAAPPAEPATSSFHARFTGAKGPALLVGDGLLRLLLSDGRPAPALRELLSRLAVTHPVYVAGGTRQSELESWFTEGRVGLVADYGLSLRPWGSPDWTDHPPVASQAVDDWVIPLLEEFVMRTPGSSIERRPEAVLWKHEHVPADFARLQAMQLVRLLEERLRGQPSRVHRTRQAVVIRDESVSPARAVRRLGALLAESDFFLCVGDTLRDAKMLEEAATLWGERAYCVSLAWGGAGGAGSDDAAATARHSVFESMLEGLLGGSTARA